MKPAVSSPSQRPRPTALVTGGARRLGRAICLRLAQAGWSLAVHYRRSQAEALGLVDELEAIGCKAAAFQLDLDTAQADDCDRLLANVQAVLGPVGLLVNNASRFEFDRPESFQADDLLAHLRSNVVSPLLLSQALYRACPPTASAVVIQLLDQKLSNPNPDFYSYTVSKYALEQGSQLMASSLAPRLRLVGLSPGITLASADQTDEEFRQTHRQTPLGQSSTAEEVADAVAWLAEARAVTGTSLLVDGGQHLQPSARDVMFSTR